MEYILRIADMDLLQKGQCLFLGLLLPHLLMGPDDVGHLGADGEDRVQAGHGFLEDHGHIPTPHFFHTLFADAQELAPHEADGTAQFRLASPRKKPGHRKGGHGFPAARFSHKAQDFSCSHREIHIVEDGDLSLLRRQGQGKMFNFQYIFHGLTLHFWGPEYPGGHRPKG